MSNTMSEQDRAEIIRLYTEELVPMGDLFKHVQCTYRAARQVILDAKLPKRGTGNKILYPAADGAKICSVCLVCKPVSAFNPSKTAMDGLKGRCKACLVAVTHASSVKRRYGIDKHTYETLLQKQKGVCACCGSHNKSSRIGRLSVDHNHSNQKIRGLLCARCNVVAGRVEDSTELLEALAAYVERHAIK